MSLDDLGQWYYLIYLLPFALSFLMIVASSLGSSHRSGTRSGHARGGSHSLGRLSRVTGRFQAGHRSGPSPRHGSGSVAGEAHHGADVSAGSHSRAVPANGRRNALRDLAADPHGPNAILSFFGIGRAPGIFLAQGFGLAWGATGFYVTRMFLDHGTPPVAAVLPTMAFAALGGIAGVKVVGEIGARLMPSEETFAMSQEDLLGAIGTVVYPVSRTMGRVHIYDPIGTLHVESARLCADVTEPIPNGQAVLLIDYDETSGCFLVERSPV